MRYYQNLHGTKRRFYRMDDEIHRRKIAGELKYVIDTWRGRIGREPGTLITYPFTSPKDAKKKIIEIHNTRMKHGYEEIQPMDETMDGKVEQLCFDFGE